MRSFCCGRRFGATLLITILSSWSCGGNSGATSPSATSAGGAASTFQLLVGAPMGLFAGDSGQASANAITSFNNNVSSQATWQSSNPGVATVGAGGAVTAVTAGTTTLTATYQGVSASDTLSVLRDSDLLSLTILSCSAQLLVGQTADCAVTMTTTGPSSGLNVAAKAGWSSTSTGVLSVAPGGHVTAVSAGQATLSASYHGKTASLAVSVTAAQQDALVIQSGAQSGQFKVGDTVSMSVGVQYSVVSADTGQLSLSVSNQNGGLIVLTSPMTVAKGSGNASLTATFTIPQGATQVCATPQLVVGSRVVLDTSRPFPNCATVGP